MGPTAAAVAAAGVAAAALALTSQWNHNSCTVTPAIEARSYSTSSSACCATGPLGPQRSDSSGVRSGAQLPGSYQGFPGLKHKDSSRGSSSLGGRGAGISAHTHTTLCSPPSGRMRAQ